MADNVELNAMSGGSTVKTDDDGTAQWQYMKTAYGADGTQTRVSETNGMPIKNDDKALTVAVTSIVATSVSVTGVVSVGVTVTLMNSVTLIGWGFPKRAIIAHTVMYPGLSVMKLVYLK